jgi:hypothetical protein
MTRPYVDATRDLARLGIALLSLGGALACPPERSPDRNGDGSVDAADAAFVEGCLGADLALAPDCAGADVDGDGRVEQADLDYVLLRLNPPPFPALLASDPVAGRADVARTAWLRLDFASQWEAHADDTLALDCGGDPRSFAATRVSPTRVVVNPDADLPAGGACALSWDGPAGRESLAFGLAAAGETASIVYDRSDPSQIPPFPDDYWLVPDASTETGLRVAIETPAAADDVVQLFDALLTDTGALDGWSPLAMIAIELSAQPDQSSLPMTPAASLDPLASVGLFDLTPGAGSYGHRVPFQLYCRDDELPGQDRASTLVAFPSVPLTPGGRYAFVVTRRALAAASRPFEASPFFASALAPAAPGEDPAIDAVRALVVPELEALEAVAFPTLPREDVALALRISVRSTTDLPRDLLAMKQQVLAEPAPAVTVTSVATNATTGRTTVRGTWQAPSWLQSIFLARDAAGVPRIVRRAAVPFVLVLPPAAQHGPVPVVMYQHGSPGNADELLQAADHLVRAGFAVAGFTDPLNRLYADAYAQMSGVFGALLFSGHVPGFWTETYGEQLAFLRALESLAAIDFLPHTAPDGIRELDLSRPLGYLGLSYGSNHGQAFLPYAPEIRAAALVTGATRISELLFWQDARDPLETGGVLQLIAGQIPSIRAPDAWVGLSIFQSIFDAQDPHNQAAFLYANPIEVAGTTRKPSVLVVEGIDDSFTTNNSTRSLAWTAGPIPHLSPRLDPVHWLPEADGSVRGNVDVETTAAFVQYAPYNRFWIEPSPACEAERETEGHYCGQLASEPQQTAFFLSALDGTPTILGADFDSDADLLPDLDEPAHGTDPADPDVDGDGLLDGAEVRAGLDPLSPSDAVGDFDGDGLSNASEAVLGTHAVSRDTDSDEIFDGAEVALGTDPRLADTDGGGRRDGTELQRDHTDPLDSSDDLPIVALPLALVDGDGFRWRINEWGGVSYGGDASFGRGARAQAFGVEPFSLEALSEENGREVVLGPMVSGSVRVTRKVYVPDDAGFVRFLEIVDNDGDAPANGSVIVRSYCEAVFLASSSGDAVLAPDDDFIVCDDGEESWSAAVVSYVFSAPGAAAEPSVASMQGPILETEIRYGFELVVPPRGRSIVMHFAALRANRDASILDARELTELAPEMLAGMSAAERADVVNFAVP